MQNYPPHPTPNYNVMSGIRKPDFCKVKNNSAGQLPSNCEADQRLCFRYMASSFPPPLTPKISRFYLSSVTAQTGLSRTGNYIVGFLTSRLILSSKTRKSCDLKRATTCENQQFAKAKIKPQISCAVTQ